jgi:hypothetical protein
MLNVNKQSQKTFELVAYFLGIGAIIFTVIMIILAFLR